MEEIIIRGARQHNLKNIDVNIPKNKLVVLTGLSGSGKSSLAFDTLYAEGQRRYVESLSTYARQFLGIMNKPDVDAIEGLSPAIAIDQKSVSQNPRSTVGTVTEIYDYLRLLFAHIGHPHCPKCGREISRQSPEEILNLAKALIWEKVGQKGVARLFILSPLVSGKKGEFAGLFENLVKKGFSLIRLDRQFFRLDEDFTILKNNRHTIEAVVDRLSFEKKDLKNEKSPQWRRLAEAINNALTLSNGEVILMEANDPSFEMPDRPKETIDHLFSELFACPVCGLSLPEAEPRTFSFNSPFGACPTCNGLGALLRFDPKLVLNLNLSVSEGGIMPLGKIYYQDSWYARIFKKFAEEEKIDLRRPLKELPKEDLKKILEGTGEKVYRVSGTNRFGEETTIREKFPGIISELKRRYEETDSDFIRQALEKFMNYQLCPTCRGTRLKAEALAVTILGKNIYQVSQLNVEQLLSWLDNFPVSPREQIIAAPILKEIKSRLTFLKAVGLDYLTQNRLAGSLAGGEAQRIRLASQIGTGLTGVLYVLDEPTIGLHPRDGQRLIDTLKNLRDLGNSVVVVEHDRQTIESADYVFDFGPGAGKNGGQVIAQGTPAEIKNNPQSVTGPYLANKKKIKILRSENPGQNKGALKLQGCSQYNLKNIDVSFPLGKFIGVTGVSGSGKSTLVTETLYPALAQALGYTLKKDPGHFNVLEGAEKVRRVYLIDQSPIGRTPRSNPATYISVFTDIRQLFASLPEAKIRGLKPGHFSFNVRGGRCEACQGFGEIKIEMQFLSDIFVKCEVCQGQRYNSDTLEIRYKEKNIAEVLSLTVEEALSFFQNIPPIAHKLQTLIDVGLGYLQLGQPAPNLSGGEAQRIKIAHELVKKGSGQTFYILDEPTTGLHFADLEKLIKVLRQLVNEGNTVVVIEHNLDLIKNCDWVIDLGPEGGERGGEIIAQGPPAEIAQNPRSYTGKYLKELLNC